MAMPALAGQRFEYLREQIGTTPRMAGAILRGPFRLFELSTTVISSIDSEGSRPRARRLGSPRTKWTITPSLPLPPISLPSVA
jgi:hypothetical protein